MNKIRKIFDKLLGSDKSSNDTTITIKEKPLEVKATGKIAISNAIIEVMEEFFAKKNKIDYKDLGVNNVHTEETSDGRILVMVKLEKPGLLIGKGGGMIRELSNKLQKSQSKKVEIKAIDL
jgi:ribosomal protein S3